MQIYDELIARGLLAQVTDEDEIRDLVNNGKATFYIGFDCTADSLTAGHFMALTLMKRMQMAGNKPIALIGGGTTMIGDPSGRTDMRKMLTREEIDHNADFDMSFIIENCNRMGIPNDFTYVDTVGMARFLLPALNRFKLDTVAKAVGVSLDHHHRAVDDAECTARIFEKFVGMCRERDITDVDKLNEQGKVSPDTIKKLPTYHAVIFMRNETGSINLYKLVSQSHIK